MSLRPKENLEYQEKTSGVSSSWNSLQIGQKWTLAGDDGWWTSGGGFTNPPDMKHFCTFLNMLNIFKHFYSLFVGACRCQEKDQCICQISNIFTFNTLWDINIMRKNGISIRYRIFHIFELSAGKLTYPTDIKSFYFLWKSSELENQRIAVFHRNCPNWSSCIHIAGCQLLFDLNNNFI